MKLSIVQRIMIFSILPKEGTLLTMKTLRGLKNKITFSEEEVREYNLHIEEDKYIWDSSKDSDFEFEVTEGEIGLIASGLKELDKQGKITEQYLELCELFSVE